MRTPEVERWIANEKSITEHLRSIADRDGYVSTGGDPFDGEKVVAYIESLEKEIEECRSIIRRLHTVGRAEE
jgi:pyruvate formate-lyase activating enzyme-like uncharacterized protein